MQDFFRGRALEERTRALFTVFRGHVSERPLGVCFAVPPPSSDPLQGLMGPWQRHWYLSWVIGLTLRTKASSDEMKFLREGPSAVCTRRFSASGPTYQNSPPYKGSTGSAPATFPGSPFSWFLHYLSLVPCVTGWPVLCSSRGLWL